LTEESAEPFGAAKLPADEARAAPETGRLIGVLDAILQAEMAPESFRKLQNAAYRFFERLRG